MGSDAAGRPPPSPHATDTTPARPDVFISYSRIDKPWVQGTLWPALVAQGRDVWIDLQDIPPAADWHARVLDGIAAANAVIFVLSPDSLASAVCAEELGRAVELNKRLVPVLRRDAGDVPVLRELELPNWIFLREGDDGEQGMAALTQALDSDLEWRDAHSRLAVRAGEWLTHDSDRSFLLRGTDLRAAEDWLARQAEHEQRPTAEQTGYVLAGRQAASRRQRLGLAAAGAALAITVALAVFALVQRDQAIERERTARSRELAASALSVLPRDPELGVLLAAEGVRTQRTGEAQDALRRSIADSHVAVTLRGHRGPLGGGVLDRAGRWAVTAGLDHTVRVWDAVRGRRIALLRGHDAPLRGVAVSPDAKRIATTGEDGLAKLHDRATGRVTAVLRGHDGIVHTPSFSRDGRLLLTGGLDGSARIWNAATGAALRVLRHRDSVFSPEFDRAARRVLTAGTDGTARVWSVRTGRTLAVLRGHDGWVNRAAFSPDGRLVATAGEDRTARVWDARTGAIVHVLRGHGARVSGVAFAPDSARLAVASDDATATVWDVARGRRLTVLRGHLDAVSRAIFSPDATLVATTAADNTARLWDAASGEPVAVLRGHTDETGNGQFSGDGRRYMTASDDGSARIWRVPPRARAIRGEGPPLRAAALSPDNSRVLTFDERGTALLVDARTGRQVQRFGVPRLITTGGAFMPRGRLLLATATGGAAAQVRDARDGRLLVRMRGPASRVAVASADGRRVLTIGFGRSAVAVWDAATGRRMAALPVRDTTLPAAALSPDGERAITIGLTDGVRAWDTASGRPLGTLRHLAGVLSPAAAFSPDSRRAVVTGLRGPLPVWNLRSRRPERYLSPRAQIPSEVVSVAWSPAGGRVAAADRGESGAVRVFDVASGRVVAELRGHRGEVRSVAFSPDGRWLTTAGLDGTARVWDVAGARQIAELLGHEGALVGATFARDGRHVLTASKDGTARLHDCLPCASLDELLAAAGGRVSAGRRLTAGERREFLHEGR